ncbi:High affinity nitrate transporter 2.5 [Symbiodinium microadriaticum]|uniref:High affinity nitrate transporter 2.5 n=2 Tax=Symbiodinium TaxID=2949 RepID=A0A1Q9DAU5_SYMMI|nr:High affinity nitrate transporter 2.5 [Symbiodinium microadriaticum]
MDKFAICMFFLAGALTVFVLCESKPRSGLPSWLANPLEVASAVRTLTIHRGLVQQFEAWVGMPILMFGAAVPAVTVMSIFGWASPDVLRTQGSASIIALVPFAGHGMDAMHAEALYPGMDGDAYDGFGNLMGQDPYAYQDYSHMQAWSWNEAQPFAGDGLPAGGFPPFRTPGALHELGMTDDGSDESGREPGRPMASPLDDQLPDPGAGRASEARRSAKDLRKAGRPSRGASANAILISAQQTMDEEAVRRLCEPFGMVVRASVMTDREGGTHSAMVEFAELEETERALKGLQSRPNIWVRRPAAVEGRREPRRGVQPWTEKGKPVSLFGQRVSVIPLCRTMAEYKLAVDSSKKATELPLLRVWGTVQQNPHMRAFWASTISFFLAFLGWFALAPLGLEVATSMGTCENQLFPPTDFPTRPAYLKFKNLKSGLSYCQYGVLKEDGKLIDCKDVPADVVSAEEKEKYRPQVLAKCVCTPGTECKSVIANAGVASVASTIFVRIALGTLLERFGPVNVQCGLMSFGAFWVAMAAAITAPWNYTLIRFFIGCAGATFVTNQFWCSLMFVVGTANATAAGWGNLGGGVTQCWDMPTARNYDPTVTGKTQKPSMWDYVEVLRDVRVLVMIFQYSACFGTELAMNNQLATHFRTYFQMDAGDASALAGAFGLMNLFASISSDICFKYFGFRGRISDSLGIWAQFLALFFEAIFLFSFGKVDNSQPWYVALAVLVCFSLFVQMAEGTSYGIVPFMNRKQLAVVSALVGAGGNLGAVTLGGRIAGFCFYKPIQDALLPFQVHAGYVMFWALLSPCYYWSEMGGMFHGPAQSVEKGKTSGDYESHTESEATTAATETSVCNGKSRSKGSWHPRSGADCHWAYIDPKGVIQVGFTSTKMRGWFEGGYFKAHLEVCPLEDSEEKPLRSSFKPLSEWFPDISQSFLVKPVR